MHLSVVTRATRRDDRFGRRDDCYGRRDDRYGRRVVATTETGLSTQNRNLLEKQIRGQALQILFKSIGRTRNERTEKIKKWI